MRWQPIETAPKDGTRILLLGKPRTHEELKEIADATHSDPAEKHRAFLELARTEMGAIEVGFWNPDGDSWVDENGDINGVAHHLEVTGTWWAGGGWFQPNEVSHWHPLPSPPGSPMTPNEDPLRPARAFAIWIPVSLAFWVALAVMVWPNG